MKTTYDLNVGVLCKTMLKLIFFLNQLAKNVWNTTFSVMVYLGQWAYNSVLVLCHS